MLLSALGVALYREIFSPAQALLYKRIVGQNESELRFCDIGVWDWFIGFSPCAGHFLLQESYDRGGEDMFRSVTEQNNKQSTLQIHINGKAVSVVPGTSVWAAMALAGETATRVSPVNQQVRSAYCAMGVCFECMVEIDGMPNRQACLTEVSQGMQINHQVITEQTVAEPQIHQPGGTKNTEEGAGHD